MPLRLVFALVSFHTTCIRASRVLVTLYALKLGAAPLTIGMLAATFAVFPVLLSWQAGKLTDRYGSRWLMLSAAAIGSCGMILPFFVPELFAVFIAAAMTGLAMTFYNLSLQNLVGRLSTLANRAQNYSNYSLFISVANMVGPLLVGILIDRSGHEVAFLCVSLLLVVPIVLLGIFGGVLPRGQRQPGSTGSILDTLSNPRIWSVIAASSVAQTGLELFQVYMPVYGNSLGLSASAIGTIVALSAAGGFVSRIFLARLIAWSSEEKVLAYALLIGAISFAGVPLCQSAAMLGVLAMLFGFGLNSSQPIVMTLMYSRSPEGRSGETLGLRFALDNGVRLAAPVLFGAVATALGLLAVFWINALMLGAGGVIAHFDAKKDSIRSGKNA